MKDIMKITEETFNKKKIAEYAKLEQVQQMGYKYSKDLLVVIGIGGSYLGAKAIIDALKNKYEEDKVLFIGESLSSLDLQETLEFLRNKDFNVNVISKSGSTLETMLTFHFIKELLWEKYGERMHKRIIATTDKESELYNEAMINKWDILTIPKIVGGRFSVFTPAGLFPIAIAGFNIENIVKGVGKTYENLQEIIDYSLYRYNSYENGKKIEVLTLYEPRLETLGKWWQQLYGESEGKDGKGVFPVYSVFTRDLHSLGQLIQEGERNIFETAIFINNMKDLRIKNFKNIPNEYTVNQVNKIAFKATKQAHESNDVLTYSYDLELLDETNLGKLMCFFMISCIVSASLLKVNPYGQPGVELYKKNIAELLK